VELNLLLQRAVELGASDIHLKTGQSPVLRLDGALSPLENWPVLDASDLSDALLQVCVDEPGRLETFGVTGDLDVAYKTELLPRFRVNGYRQRGAISFAFRLIPTQIPTFDDLYLPVGVQRLAEERQGFVVVTGPTGSGKSTTLAAIVDHINRTRRSHIVTIEDPIEYVHADGTCIVNQREVGLDTGSFQQALRQALRQDPDIILIGELRDSESAQTALQAAESGHLVLSSLHTIDAAETIARLVDFFPAEKQGQIRNVLAGVLRGVISQRLLPARQGGRIAAVEVMVVNARIEELIREHRPAEISDAIADGEFFDMQTAQKALIQLVVDGHVEREAAAAAAVNRHDFLLTLERALNEQAHREQSEDTPAPALPGLRFATRS